MKRRTKAIVFFASMALTVGSLITIAGPRHHMYMSHHNHCMHDNQSDGQWHNDESKTGSEKPVAPGQAK